MLTKKRHSFTAEIKGLRNRLIFVRAALFSKSISWNSKLDFNEELWRDIKSFKKFK